VGANGGTCSPCAANSYCVGGSLQVSCGGVATSPAGSSAASSCRCFAGYSGANAICAACLVNTFSLAGSATCTACPANTASPAISTALSRCKCLAGYTAAGDGVACTACPAGTAKVATGATACVACTAGKYAAAAGSGVCVSCPASTPVSCVSRIACYASGVQGQCPCDAGSTGGSGSAGACTPCAIGTFKTSAGVGTCAPCPAASSSPAGSSLLTACTCKPGFYGPNGGACQGCAVGSYKTVSGAASCTPCAGSSTTLANSSTAWIDCVCDTGFYGANSTVCTLCPALTNSTPPSVGVEDCACNPGHTGPGGEVTCLECAAGKYKVAMGDAACTACAGIGISSPAGSLSLLACACAVGHTGPFGGPCSLCLPGFTKAVIGNAACEVCQEHILPSKAFFQSPTAAALPCNWRCNTGHHYLEQSAFRPNACVPCVVIKPAKNPCAVGEYFNNVCSTSGDRGCRPCASLVGQGHYSAHHQEWTKAACPFNCDLGWKLLAGKCVECPSGEFCGIEEALCAKGITSSS